MEEQLPPSLFDPINLEVFTDPVIASDGYTYERRSILAWFEECRKEHQALISPLTRKRMRETLQDNLIVQQLVQELRCRKRHTTKAARAASHDEAASESDSASYAKSDTESDSEESDIEQEIQEHAQAILSNDLATQLASMKWLQTTLQYPIPPMQEVIDAGAVPRVVQFLQRHDTPELQRNAACVLCHIAWGNNDRTRVVVEAGAVPPLISLLRSHSRDVREQAVLALSSITAGCAEFRDVLLELGVFSALVACLSDTTRLDIIRIVAWAVKNCCKGKPAPGVDLLRSALPLLAKALTFDDCVILTDACWALSHVAEGSSDCIQAVIDEGVVPRLVQLLAHADKSVQTATVDAVRHILTGTDRQAQHVINAGVLFALMPLLDHADQSIKVGACGAISNICGGTPNQIQAVIDAGVLAQVINQMQHAEAKVQKEAARAVCRAISGGCRRQIEYIVGQRAIPPLCNLLAAQHPTVVIPALKSLRNIIKTGADIGREQGIPNPYANEMRMHDGVAKLNKLQQHEDKSIAELAGEIMITNSEFDQRTGDPDQVHDGGNQSQSSCLIS